MKFKRKRVLKKISLHPITSFIILTIFVMFLSSLLSWLGVQLTYSTVNKSNELENVVVSTNSLLNFEGFKLLISNAARNFASFTPLSTLLIALIGLSVAKSSGLIDTFIKNVTLKINNKTLTFIIIFVATISSIINEVGYVILIPLSALIFLANGRSPLLGITAAFCGVAFGYGVTLFAGSMEISLVNYTESAARLIDSGYHVSLLSNLFAIIISSIVISIAGTFIIENVVLKKIGKYHLSSKDDDNGNTKEIIIRDVEEEQKKRLEEEIKEKRGLKYALIALLVFVALITYWLIPGLPFSGLLLDMKESAYINKLFGANAYFQDGFTYLISIMFLVIGLAYGIGAKTIKSDKEIIEKSSIYLKDVGYLCGIIFFAAQFIAMFKESNIGTLMVAFISSIIRNIPFGGIPLIIVVLILIALASIFIPYSTTFEWSTLSTTVVPLLMQKNMSPQFAQFLFRVGDSMTKGITPLLAYFVIYLGYLNVYNTEKEPISIRKAMSFISPYCLLISLVWILISIFIYIIGIPIGPSVSPVL